MSYTMADFTRDYLKQHLARLTPREREDLLQSLPTEERLAGLPLEERMAGLSAEQIRQYLERLTATGPSTPRKPRRKK